MNDELFTLQRKQPQPRATQFVSHGGAQKVLFSGLDCLAGQQDLFPTDGPRERDPAPPPKEKP